MCVNNDFGQKSENTTSKQNLKALPEPGIEPDVRCKQNWAKDTGIASLILIQNQNLEQD